MRQYMQYMQYSGDWRCNTVSNQPTALADWLSPSFQFVSIDDAERRIIFVLPLSRGGAAGMPVGSHGPTSLSSARNLIHPMHPPLRFMISSFVHSEPFHVRVQEYIYLPIHRTNEPAWKLVHTLGSYTAHKLSSTSTSYQIAFNRA